MRGVLVLSHRWFGLIGALWLFLVGLTGSVLVFYAELDHALNPELFKSRGGEVVATVDGAIAAVEASGDGRRVTSFWKGAQPAGAWTFYIAGDEGTPEVYLDPTTGKVTGERVWNELKLDRPHLMPMLYTFHYSLFLGGVGDWLIGLLGFVWLLDHVVAGVLSFPSAKRWRESFRIRRAGGHKLTFDLHRAIGLWLIPVTFIVALTGTYMNWRPYAWAIVGVFSEMSPWPGSDRPALPAPMPRPAMSFSQAIAAAKAETPQGASYNAVTGLYSVTAFDARDLTRDYGMLYTVVDARTGKIVDQRHLAHGTAADVIDAWQLPLHSGKVAGWPGRIAIFLSGLALCSFVVTGLMLWARKRRARNGRRNPT